MNPTITRAREQHLDGLTPLFDNYRQFYRQPSNPDAARRYLSERLAADESVIFVASLLDNKELVGFTQLYPLFSSVQMQKIWVLNDLYVAKQARRKGVARTLMNTARDFALSTGAARIELETGRSNTSAQALYNSLNYERDDEHWHYSLALDTH